ncbi:replication initiator protein [Capybara microvirus Cap3_SP_316]|nr:replication initiator protein [Capybara microvirus Cap3_SP_316]
MICRNPIDSSNFKYPIYDALGRTVKVPCNTCLACRANKILNYSARISYERINNPECSFVTFTYDKNHLKYNFGFYEPTLKRSDLHKYIDKVRHLLPKDVKFKYFASGQYGDRFNRPHYHVLFIGLDFVKYYKFFKDSWNLGSVDVQPMLSGSVQYVCSYLHHQKFGSDSLDSQFFDNGLDEPFLSMSPGIGSDFYLAHIFELLNGLPVFYGSSSVQVPSYYRRKYLKLSQFSLDNIRDSLVLNRKYHYNSMLEAGYTDFGKFVKMKSEQQDFQLINSLRSRGCPISQSYLFGNTVYSFDKGFINSLANSALKA